MTDELEKLINSSELSSEDKQLWINTLENADKELASMLLTYLRDYPNKLSWFTGILKRKIKAMKNNDPAEWEKITREEAEELKKMIKE